MTTGSLSPNKPDHLPIVEFEYPDSETNLLKTRFVEVTKMDNAYLEGYELPTIHVTKTTPRKFKKFRMARITKDGVALRSF